MDTDEFLEHVGVKGMKWGVRKRRATDRDRTAFGKSPRRLSNEEIKKRIGRMESEKRYNDLNKRDKSLVEAAAQEVIIQSGKAIAQKVLINAGSYGIKLLIQKKFGETHAKGMFPKK